MTSFMTFYAHVIMFHSNSLIPFRMLQPISRGIIFRCKSLLKYKVGANFRMMTRWCQETNGLTTLMLDIFVVAGMTSTDYKIRLADEFGVMTRTPNPRPTKPFLQKINNHLTKQPPKYMISNVQTKLLIKAFIQTANTCFKVLIFQ